ncbi:MAG TPA: aconitase family protein, partial [Polyangiaceae bacterium]|nr:aconitase family protein [Polyangiaceae bacterium]
DEASADDPRATAAEFLARGLLVARAGAGFPAAVHTERFACPARLCVTDEPRLAGVGGIGMLTLVVPPSSLARALSTRRVLVRSPVSVQVILGGRLRPFVCARDVSLELLRRGLGDVVRRIEEERGAPVVLEFTGPSARLLSVGERCVVAALAPQVGAAAALFVSDERTEVFLRDQRRSKAHRVLAPDAGAPCEEVFNVDLGAVDPLASDEQGQVRPVRDLAGRPVTQAILGGDSGASLRDLLAAAALLKSKRVPSRLDFLLATPSRQMLEVLAATGALADLIATGARPIEPDARVVGGGLYGPVRGGLSLRTSDPQPRTGRPSAVVVSAETLAYAVATGEVGDPRAFKRPVRVTVPRMLPTDDVLVARRRDRVDSAGASRPPGKASQASTPGLPGSVYWRAAETLDLVDGASIAAMPAVGAVINKIRANGVAVLCATLDEVRDLSGHAHELAKSVRAVLAPYIPGALVGLFSAAGIAAIRVEAGAVRDLAGQPTLLLPAPAHWPEQGAASVSVGSARVELTWLARGVERSWATGGSTVGSGASEPARVAARPVAGAVAAEQGGARDLVDGPSSRGLAVLARAATARGAPDH